METCVLIPQEFALVLTTATTTETDKVSKEHIATVWTTNTISQGTLFYPFQGTVRIDKLDIYSSLNEDDVSYGFSHEIK